MEEVIVIRGCLVLCFLSSCFYGLVREFCGFVVFGCFGLILGRKWF